MGAYVNLINGVYERLKSAMGEGQRLERIRRLYLGQAVRVEGVADMPCLILGMRGMTERYAACRGPQGAKVGETTITLTLLHPILELKTSKNRFCNGLYTIESTGGTTRDSYANNRGILYTMELIGDALHETAAQSVDPRVVSGAESSMQLEWSEIGLFTDEIYQVDATITLQTAHFTINGRSE